MDELNLLKETLSSEAYKNFIEELNAITDKIPSKWLVTLLLIVIILSLFNKFILPYVKALWNFIQSKCSSEKAKRNKFLMKCIPDFINAFHIDRLDYFSERFFTGYIPYEFLETYNTIPRFLNTIIWPKDYSGIRTYITNIKEAYYDFIYLFREKYESEMHDIVEFVPSNASIFILKKYKNVYSGQSCYTQKEEICKKYIARCDCSLRNVIFRVNEFIEYLSKCGLEELDDSLSRKFVLHNGELSWECTEYIDLTSDEEIEKNQIQI